MRWSRVFVYVLVLGLSLLPYTISDTSKDQARHVASSSSSLYERAVQEFVNQRRMFLDGFSNGTAVLENQYDEEDEDLQSKATGEGEGRGRRKRLRQMNRTLMAMVMAFSLKFMFLIPTFIGTLILLKFTTALAGFFYALFAAVLGLDQHHHHRH